MASRTVQGIAAALGTVAILAGATAQASAAQTTTASEKWNDVAATPASYATYLRHSSEEGSADVLKGFQRLTPAQQSKFVGYLHDPALLTSFLDKTAGQGSERSAYIRNAASTTSLRDGDIVVAQERNVSRVATARPLPAGNHTVTYTTYVKYFGVKVIKMNLSVTFHSNGHDITKVTDAEPSLKNFSGAISISHAVPKKSLSNWGWCQRGHTCSRGHNADASVIWEGTVVYKGSTFQFDKKQWMRANVYGKLIDYYVHNV
ncbi:hypothetical protein [Streptomyces sp. NPDC087294]|uniref:hypothetical protein n=1 Tax=Streptomyces sp. NPDC087294 TaxID=3365777 RepID=UPI003808590E